MAGDLLKKLAFVTTSMERAGAQAMLLKLLPGLLEHGFSSVIISLTSSGPLSAEFARLGVPVYHLGAAPGRISIRALTRLVAILKSEEPDLIQGWMYHGNLAARLAAWLLHDRPPVAWSIRGTHTQLAREKGLTALTIWAGAKLSSYASAIIYNSKVSAQEHWRKLQYNREREFVIPNGFDTATFVPSFAARKQLRAELGTPEQAVLIGLVARLHPVKDHRTFIEAIARVHARHEDVHGVLIGAGTERTNPKIASMLLDAGAVEFVHCLGERTDLPMLTAALDVSCNSSVSEGFANAIGEAMACGVPCAVTDVGESARIVGDTGRVVAPSDPESLAVALDSLVSMGRRERQALGELARQRVLDKFSLAAVVKQYAQVYETVTAEMAC